MKHGKKPTLAQKMFMQESGMTREQSESYLVIKDTPESMIVIHKSGGDPLPPLKKRRDKFGTHN
jgi:hypothetical protein